MAINGHFWHHQSQHSHSKYFSKTNFGELKIVYKKSKPSLCKANSCTRYLAKRDKTVATTLVRKRSCAFCCVILTKIIRNLIVPMNYFVILSAWWCRDRPTDIRHKDNHKHTHTSRQRHRLRNIQSQTPTHTEKQQLCSEILQNNRFPG